MAMSDSAKSTIAIRGHVIAIRQFELAVVEGPDRGKRVMSQGDQLTIGTNTGNDLQLTDGAVSRHHCVIRTVERGLELRDLDSTNGTRLGDCEVGRVIVRSEARIRVGSSVLAIKLLEHEIEQPLAQEDHYGELYGASAAMRRLYPIIKRCAEVAGTVLIEGETGTGKELVAESIHRASARRHGPFVVVDCTALPRNQIESELFGHVRGAFAGADRDQTGALVSATGGTLLLDEIGELPLAVQPALLRALESRTVRPLGISDAHPVDVRIIASTHRDLRVEVNHKRFRADLYYRLNVLRIELPPLRQRSGDIALLCNHFWRMFRPDSPPPAELIADYVAQSWPGNVRELRNAIERVAAFGPVGHGPRAAPLSYGQAKEQAVLDWERGWVEQLLTAHRGNLSRAARAVRMGRSHLREIARRHNQTTNQLDAEDDG
jgi:DNA-binding NtrC family response regulator